MTRKTIAQTPAAEAEIPLTAAELASGSCPRRHWLSLCGLPVGHEGNHRGWLNNSQIGWTDEQCSGPAIVCENVT